MQASGDEPIYVFTGQTTGELMPQLQEAAARDHPALVIVDTMQRLIRARDLNDYAEVTTRLEPVLNLTRKTGAAVVLLHHSGKSDRNALDSVLGSTALTGSVDNLFELKRTDQHRLLSSVQRVGPDLPATIVALGDDEGRVELGPTKADADEAEIRASVLEALRVAGVPIDERTVMAEAEGRTQVKCRVLRALVREGKVLRTGQGTRGNPYLYSPSLLPPTSWEQGKEKPRDGSTCSVSETYFSFPTSRAAWSAPITAGASL